jgi:hypothetical protein
MEQCQIFKISYLALAEIIAELCNPLPTFSSGSKQNDDLTAAPSSALD